MFNHLCKVEVILILQFLDLTSLLAAASCNKQLRDDANSKTAWKYLPKFYIKKEITTPQVLMLHHPQLCFNRDLACLLSVPLQIQMTINNLSILYAIYNNINAVLNLLKTSKRLTSLILFNVNIGDEGAVAIANALKVNNTLISLYLGWNNIGDIGAVALADALKHNNALTSLNLYKNNISVEGAVALADALKHNNSVTSLDLGCNKIDNLGAAAFADALKYNNAVISLILGWKKIDNIGAAALVDALKYNNTITNLYFHGINISKKLINAVKDIMKLRKNT